MKAEILLFPKRSFPVSFQQNKTSEIEYEVQKVVLKRDRYPLSAIEKRRENTENVKIIMIDHRGSKMKGTEAKCAKYRTSRTIFGNTSA